MVVLTKRVVYMTVFLMAKCRENFFNELGNLEKTQRKVLENISMVEVST